MNTHLALLRGINVGGNKKVPMAELRTLLESLGFAEVKTILASGNALFNTEQEELDLKIQDAIRKHFGFEVSVHVIPFQEIEKLIAQDPFKNLPEDKNIKAYVTFLKDADTLFNTVDTDQERSVDFMTALDKKYGKTITTRTWKTILRIDKANKTS
jgi:uncharacterized protein (DUF1697 family)